MLVAGGVSETQAASERCSNSDSDTNHHRRCGGAVVCLRVAVLFMRRDYWR